MCIQALHGKDNTREFFSYVIVLQLALSHIDIPLLILTGLLHHPFHSDVR